MHSNKIIIMIIIITVYTELCASDIMLTEMIASEPLGICLGNLY